MNRTSAERREAWSWSAALRIAAEASAMVSILAFALSCVLNSYVFWTWGHDFLQLATPSDVVMSGLRILVSLLGPLLIASALAAPLVFFMSATPRIQVHIAKLPNRALAVALKKAHIFIIGLIAVSWLGLFPLIILNRDKLSSTVEICIGLFLVTAGLVCVRDWFRDRPTEDVVFYWIMTLLSLACGSIATTRWFYDRIERQSETGFHAQQLAVLVGSRDVCGAGSRLLWSGNQTDLIECPLPGRGRSIMVLRGAENIIYVPRPAGP